MFSSLMGINDIILIFCYLVYFSGSCFDCCFYVGVGIVLVEIVVYSCFDLCIGGFGCIGEEGRGCYNLACLVIIILWYIVFELCLLYWMVVFFGKAFDGGDGFVFYC